MEVKRLDLAKPVMAQFELTHLCNHRCAHCYRLEFENHYIGENISDATVLQVAQKLADANIFNVVVTGGEPLIKQKLAVQVITLLRQNGVQVGVNSNITLLTDDFITFLKENNVNLLTSCPSSDKTKFNQMVGGNKYDLFVERLNKVIESGVHCTVNMVVTKDNIGDIKSTALFLKEMGVYSFSATPMFLNMDSPQLNLLLTRDEVMGVIEDILWVESELKMKVDILESLPKCVFPKSVRNSSHSFLNRKCQAGRTVIGVSPNGDIRPCSTNTEVYGNILSEDIKEIWSKMRIWRSTEYFPDKCKECSWINRCNAGCRINSKAFFGQWNSQEIWSGDPLEDIPESDYRNYNLSEKTKISLNQNFSYREEYENVFVIFNHIDESFMMINGELMNFIKSLGNISFKTIGDLAKVCGVSAKEPDFVSTINLLINKKILDYEF